MSVLTRDFDAPPDVKDGEEKDAERVERFLRQRLQVLSKDRKERLEKFIKKTLKAALKESQPLLKRLVKWSDQLEGVVEETNFPFEGASNVTLRLAMGLARTFRASFNKTQYLDDQLFAAVFDPGAEKELNLTAAQIEVLEEGFNHSFSTEFNGLECLKGGTLPAWRDGTFLIEGSWERRVERVHDQRVYRQEEAFLKDYPDAATAGVSAEYYQEALDLFLVEGEEAEVLVRFGHDAVTQDGVEYRYIPRARFVVYPTSVKRIRDAVLYGGGSELSVEELKRRGRKKEYYAEGVERAVAKRGRGSESDSWDKARLFVEGRVAPDPDMAPIKVFDLVVKYDLDGDGTPELWRVRVTRDGDEVCLLSCRPYDVRRNVRNVVPFRLVGRDGSFDGDSQVGDGEDLFNQVDTLFRHDNNVMMLTTSPVFIADAKLKDEIDLGRSENVIRPGVTYWLTDPTEKSFHQLAIADVAAASGKNQDKIGFLMRATELLVGVSQGESGQQTPDDPNAPARKTQLLLMQSNKSTDDKIDEWCLSYPDLAALHAALLVMYAPGSTYKFKKKGGGEAEFPLALLADRRLRWRPKRRSVVLTPEFAQARLQALFGAYAQMRSLIAQDPVVREIWERLVKSSGEPQAEKFLVSPEQAAQMMQAMMQQMQQHAEMQSTLKARAKGKEKLATESAKTVVNHIGDQMKAALTVPQPTGAPPGGPGPGGV